MLKRRWLVSIMSSDREAGAVTRTGKGKVVDRGFKYSKIFIYIPKDVATDTNFPFKIGEDVTVTINGKKVIITKKKT